jgi:hypothetical protein
MKFLKVTLLSFIISAACFANLAKATLIDGNEWMQLTDTKGYTWQQFNQVFDTNGYCDTDCLLGGTIDVTGYRWASSAEVDNMVSSVTGSALFANYTSNINNVAGADSQIGLLALLDATRCGGSYVNKCQTLQGYTRNEVNQGAGSGIRIFDWIGVNNGWNGAYNLYVDMDVNTVAGYGGWLYQDSPPESVPEPSTLAIFALGMIGLASRRFKKQS